VILALVIKPDYDKLNDYTAADPGHATGGGRGADHGERVECEPKWGSGGSAPGGRSGGAKPA